MFDLLVTGLYIYFHKYKFSAAFTKKERERVAKLSVSCLSPAHRTKLKCAKMRCYYKELREREQQAKIRNLELLGNVENLASKMKEFSIDCSRLLQKRVTTLGSFICPNIHHMRFLKQYSVCIVVSQFLSLKMCV